jgi:hypothetical protein
MIESFDHVQDKSEIQNVRDELVKFHAEIDFNKYREFFIEIAKVYNDINKENWTVKYQTSYIYPNTDKVFFKFNATPIESKYVQTNEPIKLEYDFIVKGGWKIDISSGLFWLAGVNDDVYRFEARTDSTTAIIKSTNDSWILPSLGVLFNVYKRSNKNVKFAFNFGAGTDIKQIEYYLGGGLLLGRYERIGLNVGIVGKFVNKVSYKYQVEDGNERIIDVALSDLPDEVPMQNPSPFQVGIYFGITYNLTGKNEEKSKSIFRTQ